MDRTKSGNAAPVACAAGRLSVATDQGPEVGGPGFFVRTLVMSKHRRHRSSVHLQSIACGPQHHPGLTAKTTRIFAAAALAVLYWVSGSDSLAQEQEVIENGRQLFSQKCAICHGQEGKGDGTLGLQLKKRPADLSQVSKRNGGTFPFWRVYGTIDGRQDIGAHGPREMPVWGSDERYVGTGGRLASGQILEIVFFLQSIQEK